MRGEGLDRGQRERKNELITQFCVKVCSLLFSLGSEFHLALQKRSWLTSLMSSSVTGSQSCGPNNIVLHVITTLFCQIAGLSRPSLLSLLSVILGKNVTEQWFKTFSCQAPLNWYKLDHRPTFKKMLSQGLPSDQNFAFTCCFFTESV